MKPVFYILLATALTWSVSYSLGAMFLRALRLKLYRSEERFFAFIAGSGVLSTLVFLLTAAGLARKAVFWGTGLAIVGVAVWRRVYRAQGESLPALIRSWSVLFWVGFALFTWLYLGNALAPETSADAVSYHVALVARYAREHHFPWITTNIYANLSEGVEMLFLFAFPIGKHSAAAMCEFLFLLTLPFGILSYARRIGRPVAGVVAALIVFTSPVFGRVGTVAHNDVAGAAVVFAMFYAIQIWRDGQDHRMPVLAGMLAGYAYAIKYTLGIAVIYAGAAVLFVAFKRKQPWLKPAAITGVAALAMMAPWLIKNTIIVHNPVSPFFNRLFPNAYVYPGFEDGYIKYLRAYEGVKPAEIPLEVTIRGDRLQGLLGPVFLLAPVALIALRTPAGRQLLLVAAIFLLPYVNNVGTRFLMPSATFVALALGLVVDAFPWLAAAVAIGVCLLSWPQVVPLYAKQYAWRIEGSNWKAALRRVSEEQYIRDRVADYDIGKDLDRLVPASQPVLSASMGNQAYHTREIVVPYQSAFGGRLYDALFRATASGMRPELRRTFSFSEREVRRLRLAVTNRGAPWAVAELRVFDKGRELARDPRWRLRASPAPWDVQRAFDNSPVTVWSSDEPARPGMFIEIDFGRPERIDKVVADMPANNWEATMRVEGDGAALSDKPAGEEIPLPPRMRRAAIEELEANGIHWMVFKDGDLLADDLLMRHLQWGITQVASRNGYRLWHLD
jgi:hypothetical protein